MRGNRVEVTSCPGASGGDDVGFPPPPTVPLPWACPAGSGTPRFVSPAAVLVQDHDEWQVTSDRRYLSGASKALPATKNNER